MLVCIGIRRRNVIHDLVAIVVYVLGGIAVLYLFAVVVDKFVPFIPHTKDGRWW